MSEDCGSLRNNRWYCVRSAYRSEALAYTQLVQAGYTSYCPQYISRKAGHKPKALIYYPRYLFVSFDKDLDQWRRIFSVRGVEHLFMLNPTTPEPIRRGVIETLKAMGRPGDGLIDEANPTAPDLTGTTVRINGGAFTKLTGLVSSSSEERVQVLLSMFGRPVTADIARKDVEPT